MVAFRMHRRLRVTAQWMQDTVDCVPLESGIPFGINDGGAGMRLR